VRDRLDTPSSDVEGNRDRLIDTVRSSPAGAAQIGVWLKQGVFLALGALAVYLFWPQLLEVVSSAPRLRTIRPGWFVVMVVMEIMSFACVWWLMRVVLPKVSWFVAATSQLVSNAVSRVVPGGAAVGGATLYRMLAVSGTSPAEAGGALAATSILSTAALFAIPATALVMAFFGAPIPESLVPVAAAGGVLFGLLVVVGIVALFFDRPLHSVGVALDRVARAISKRLPVSPSVDPDRLLSERDRLVEVLGGNWRQAIGAAALNWAFDYLALVAALYAVGADPRLSLVLLAYAGAIVMSMIPITPGGLGFVEAALLALLVLSGISAQSAGLATLAYRTISLLLPLLAAVPAWVLYRWRFRPDIESLSAEG
jgi:uncharacterized membrane protein YbhN (UPF0104 family)